MYHCRSERTTLVARVNLVVMVLAVEFQAIADMVQPTVALAACQTVMLQRNADSMPRYLVQNVLSIPGKCIHVLERLIHARMHKIKFWFSCSQYGFCGTTEVSLLLAANYV